MTWVRGGEVGAGLEGGGRRGGEGGGGLPLLLLQSVQGRRIAGHAQMHFRWRRDDIKTIHK